MTIVADTTATQPDPASGRRPGRGDLDPGRGQRHVRGDRQAGRADQGDRHRPLREPRPDQHQPDRRRERRPHRLRRPLPDDGDDHRAAGRAGRPDHLPGPCQRQGRRPSTAARTATSTRARITIVPSGENAFFLKVTNPAADQRRDAARSSRRVTQEDVDGALAALNAVARPGVPGGDGRPGPRRPTGRRSSRRPAVSASRRPTSSRRRSSARRSPTFALGLSATGTVIAVDRRRSARSPRRRSRTRSRPATSWSRARSRSRSATRSSSASRSASRSTATAEQIAVLDADELKAMVLGKPVEEARAILAPFGDVALEVSPDWTGSVPGFESRVDADDRPGRPDRDAGSSAPAATPRPTATPTPPRVPARDATARDRPRRAPDRAGGGRRRRVGRATACPPAPRPRPRRRCRRAGRRHRGAGRSTSSSSACRSRRRATRVRRPTLTRAWGEAIRERLDLPVSFRDERLTSHLAEAGSGR